ncbi:hypothetical protein [uncultured Meiothermus sp.]|jgi:predicted nucleic acid-binding protein|uniref:hypothetical protein n=1 Tax=uncultured Meiothermus sp. TaxID=157471 RepID=UPI00261BCC84|nr:hypothetical protein [uncultured Meiothermus sp.]
MSKVWVDSHWVLRLLRGDHPQHSPRARAFLEQAEQGVYSLQISPVMLAETAAILTDAYGHPVKDVAEALLKLLTNPALQAQEESLVLAALELMKQKPLPFSVAYTVAQAKTSGQALAAYASEYKGLGAALVRVE